MLKHELPALTLISPILITLLPSESCIATLNSVECDMNQGSSDKLSVAKVTFFSPFFWYVLYGEWHGSLHSVESS